MQSIKACCTQVVIHRMHVFSCITSVMSLIHDHHMYSICAYSATHVTLHLMLQLDYKPALFEDIIEWWRNYIAIKHHLFSLQILITFRPLSLKYLFPLLLLPFWVVFPFLFFCTLGVTSLGCSQRFGYKTHDCLHSDDTQWDLVLPHCTIIEGNTFKGEYCKQCNSWMFSNPT